MVVRRICLNVEIELFENYQVPIAYTCMEPNLLVTKLLVQFFINLPASAVEIWPALWSAILPSAIVIRLHLKTQSSKESLILRATASIGARPV